MPTETLRLSDDLLMSFLSDDPNAIPDSPLHVSLRFSAQANFSGNEIGPAGSTPLLDSEQLILRGAGLEEALRLSNVARPALVSTDRQPQSILPRMFRPHGNTDDALDVPLIAYANSVTVNMCPGRVPTLIPRTEDNPKVAKLAITPDTEWLAPGKTESDGTEEPVAEASNVTATKMARPIPARNLTHRHLPEAWPEDKLWIIPPQVSSQPLRLRMILPGFNDNLAGNDPDTHHAHILLGHDPRAANPGFDSPGSLFFAIANSEDDPHFYTLAARLGSIAFSRKEKFLLVDESGTEANASGLVIGRRHRPLLNRREGAEHMNTLDVAWTLGLAMDEALPVTTDIPHGLREERPNDLLIRETSVTEVEDVGGGAPFHLIVTERLRDDQDRHLTAELFERTSRGRDARATFTVLGEAPFTAFRFSRRPLDSGEAGRPVASFDSDDRVWRLLLTGDTYRFTRPAGAVGEDADKPGMLELHDPVHRSESIPPAPPMSQDGAPVPRRHAVDMRLSPPTTLWVEPSDLERNYFVPEYAARELFRQRGDFGLGVRLTALRGELIYGLPYSVLVPQGNQNAPGPRVAELQALTGRMAPSNPKTENTSLAARWRRLRQAFRHRPEKLEVWTLDASRQDPFVPAKFRDGVNLSLRHTALLAPPVKNADAVTPGAARQEGYKPPRFHDRGLSGGAIWPLESANVTRVIAANPVATGGEVDGIELSPLGDSGNQAARFLDGYVNVISETRDGFLQKHRVEVLGRIAGLWHRAKHVVVYERTTASSPQFVPHPIQATRSQRPILRKVEEFVEILQPIRRYPDTADVPARACGCLEEVRFNSTIIHVNSAWGEDVGATGWRVPLWNRGEAELRPQVYPYPDVAFVTTGEGDGPAPRATQECLDVATTYFYTDPVAAQESTDTDLWPARFGTDSTGLCHAQTLRNLLGLDPVKKEEAAVDSRRPAAGRILPGTRQFTWRLAPAPIRSRINAKRGAKPIFSGLASVTLVRDPGGTLAPDAVANIDAAVKVVETHKDELAQLTSTDIPLPRTRDNAETGIGEYDAVVDALETLVSNPSAANADSLGQALSGLSSEGAIKNFDAWLAKGGGIVDEVKVLLGDAKEAFDKAKEFDQKDCNAVAAKAAESIRRRKLLVLQMVRQARTEYIAEINAQTALIPDQAKTIILELIQEATQDVFDQANQTFGDIRGGVATARAAVADWRTDVHVAMDQSRARIASMRKNFDASKPWSRNRVDKVFAQLKRELDAVEQEAFAALDEARLRMATEISVSANGVTARVAAAIERVLRAEREALAKYDDIATAVDSGAQRVLSLIAKVPPASDIEAKLDDMDQKVANLSNGAVKDSALATMEVLRNAFNAADLDGNKSKAETAVGGLKALASAALKDAAAATSIASDLTEDLLNGANALSAQAHSAAADLSDTTVVDIKLLAEEINTTLTTALDGAQKLVEKQLRAWADEIRIVDEAAAKAEAWIVGNTRVVDEAAALAQQAVDQWSGAFEEGINQAEAALSNTLWVQFETQVISPVVDRLYDATQWPEQIEEIKAQAIAVTETLADEIEEALDGFAELPLSKIEEAKAACVALVGIKTNIMDGLDEVVRAGAEQLQAVLGPVSQDIQEVIQDFTKWGEKADEIVKGTEKLLDAANEIGNQIAEAGDSARAYLDRGAELLSRAAQASPGQLPGLALQLVSAATQAPEIAAFRANADRIRVLFDDARDVLETPAIRGLLDQLGDGLKSIGLNFSFTEFGDQFLPDVDGDALLRKLMPDCGINIEDMLRSAVIPGSVSNAIKVTHDLDAKAGRAWIQADVNVSLPGREPMFTIGPFTLFLKDTLLNAFMRAEASKDQEDVALSDRSLIKTTIEAVVAGQVMVTLQDVEIRYSSKDQLDFSLDPKKIRIHQTMRYVPNTDCLLISSLFLRLSSEELAPKVIFLAVVMSSLCSSTSGIEMEAFSLNASSSSAFSFSCFFSVYETRTISVRSGL